MTKSVLYVAGLVALSSIACAEDLSTARAPLPRGTFTASAHSDEWNVENAPSAGQRHRPRNRDRLKEGTQWPIFSISNIALDAHGGLDNWQGVAGVDLRLTLGGYLFEIKQHPNGLRTALVKVDARRPRTLIVPSPERGKRGIYQEGKVWVQTDAGAMVEELPSPRTAYEGHERHTPWNDLQYLYFVGYAFWNYFTTPFLLASDGVICEEVESWEENRQKWRVLKATFDSSIDTHCEVQKFYFDDRGMLKRHDYFTDVAKGNVAHYCMDYKTLDGFVFPTRRRVVSRGEGEFTATGGPSSVLIDIGSVVVNRG